MCLFFREVKLGLETRQFQAMLKHLNVHVYDFSTVTDDLIGLSFIRLWNPIWWAFKIIIRKTFFLIFVPFDKSQYKSVSTGCLMTNYIDAFWTDWWILLQARHFRDFSVIIYSSYVCLSRYFSHDNLLTPLIFNLPKNHKINRSTHVPVNI